MPNSQQRITDNKEFEKKNRIVIEYIQILGIRHFKGGEISQHFFSFANDFYDFTSNLNALGRSAKGDVLLDQI